MSPVSVSEKGPGETPFSSALDLDLSHRINGDELYDNVRHSSSNVNARSAGDTSIVTDSPGFDRSSSPYRTATSVGPYDEDDEDDKTGPVQLYEIKDWREDRHLLTSTATAERRKSKAGSTSRSRGSRNESASSSLVQSESESSSKSSHHQNGDISLNESTTLSLSTNEIGSKSLGRPMVRSIKNSTLSGSGFGIEEDSNIIDNVIDTAISDNESPRIPIPGKKIGEKDLASHLQLPSDVLFLKKEDIKIHGTTSVGWIVCSAIPLPQGSSLGPFQGQQVSSDAVKVGDLIIQVIPRVVSFNVSFHLFR